MEELFFSVISIKESILAEKLNQKQLIEALNSNQYYSSNLPIKRKRVFYLWALWDIYPSFDVYRPPVLSGIMDNKDDVVKIAKQNGLDTKINFDQNCDVNTTLKRITESNFKLISFQKRQTGFYFFCVWGNQFQYLCGIEPIFQKDNITEAELKTLKTSWGDGDWAGMWFGGYIKNYIRKREAQRKLTTPKNGCNDAIFIDFLYSPKNTWHIPRKRWIWQRHRIVKKTKQFIYIEQWPYYGGGYLKTGWQAFIVYTIMIDRKTLEETHEFHHTSRRKVFYEKCAVPELKSYRFNKSDYEPYLSDSDYDNDFVIEIPLNSVQWALNLLKIDKWPTTKEVIKKAFNLISIKEHPDKGGDGTIFISCKRARDFLTDLIKGS